jgi:hypothetical protein
MVSNRGPESVQGGGGNPGKAQRANKPNGMRSGERGLVDWPLDSGVITHKIEDTRDLKAEYR